MITRLEYRDDTDSSHHLIYPPWKEHLTGRIKRFEDEIEYVAGVVEKSFNYSFGCKNTVTERRKILERIESAIRGRYCYDKILVAPDPYEYNGVIAVVVFEIGEFLIEVICSNLDKKRFF